MAKSCPGWGDCTASMNLFQHSRQTTPRRGCANSNTLPTTEHSEKSSGSPRLLLYRRPF